MSTGLPVFNAQRYLAAALDSHLSQSYEDFELMVSDNGSTDGTQDICEDYARRDARIRYLRYDQNKGLSWNHSNALAQSRGHYFRWGAADDLLGDGLLSELVEILDGDAGIVLCSPRVSNIDADGIVTGTVVRSLDLQSADPLDRINAVLTRTYQMVYPQGLMRRESLMSTSRRWTYFGWDFILLFELALRGRITETERSILLRRLHQGQASRVQRDVSQGMKTIEPTFHGRLLLPHWRWTLERLRAAIDAPVSSVDRRRALSLTLRHAWWTRKELVGDVSASFRLLTGRSNQAPF